MYLTTEESKAFQALVESVAVLLPGWKFCPPADEDQWAVAGRIQHPDGRALNVAALEKDQGSFRLSVSGSWPKDPKGACIGPWDLRQSLKSITVSSRRGAPLIAAEIERRYLPRYTEIWGLALAEINRRRERQRALKEAQSRIAEALGLNKPETTQYADLASGRMSAEVTSPEDVKLDIFVPLDVALKVIALLRRLS